MKTIHFIECGCCGGLHVLTAEYPLNPIRLNDLYANDCRNDDNRFGGIEDIVGKYHPDRLVEVFEDGGTCIVL